MAKNWLQLPARLEAFMRSGESVLILPSAEADSQKYIHA